jgi:DNA-binding NtrC family response regulator
MTETSSKPFVVAVDDDPLIRSVLSRILERAAFDVAAFEGVSQAVLAIEARVPDIVITDIFLGAHERSGVDLIAWIRERFQSIPILAMSGGDSGGDSQFARATEAGATAVIEKPVRAPVVVETVKRMLAGRPG